MVSCRSPLRQVTSEGNVCYPDFGCVTRFAEWFCVRPSFLFPPSPLPRLKSPLPQPLRKAGYSGYSLGFCHHVDFRVVASPDVRESKTFLQSEFHAVYSGFQLLDSRSFSMKLGFRIPIVSGILDSKVPDSRFQMQKFPGCPNPDSLTWGEFHQSGKSVETFSISFWEMGNRTLPTAVCRYAFEVSRCPDFKFQQGVQFSSVHFYLAKI